MTSGHPYLRRRRRPVAEAAPAGTTTAPGGSATPSHTSTVLLPRTPAAPAARAAGTAPRPAGPSIHVGTAAPAGSAAPAGPSERVLRRRAELARRVRPFPAPHPRAVRLLGPDDPVVRIDRRRSAVGALTVTGCTSAAWETVDWTVGATTAAGAEAGRRVVTAGNRPLVGFEDGTALVSLRHVRQLRRALFMARGTERLVVSLHDGTTVGVAEGTPDTMTVLALSVVDGELELRAEPFARATHDGDVFAAFGFVLSTPVPGV